MAFDHQSSQAGTVSRGHQDLTCTKADNGCLNHKFLSFLSM